MVAAGSTLAGLCSPVVTTFAGVAAPSPFALSTSSLGVHCTVGSREVRGGGDGGG